MKQSPNRFLILAPAILLAALLVTWSFLAHEQDSSSLVVYCAHDRIFAESLLEEFTKTTGIRIKVRYDTEATKSLGLINQIVQEQAQPRCDVFWNNELLGTVDLAEQGLLESHRGTGWERMPDQFRDPEARWVGFGARMRVWIVNSAEIVDPEETANNLLSFEPASVAMAKPLFGTTLTHYTVLWHLWGSEDLKRWHRELRLRGMREVDGNAAVKDIVTRGTCRAGLTDTDDVFVALDDNQTVDMFPARVKAISSKQSNDNGAAKPANAGGSSLTIENAAGNSVGMTICIPNSVGIIKGTKRKEAASRLVDFLTSEQAELALARSKSRQIPLGPVDAKQIPDEVRRLVEWSKDAVDLRNLLPARRECLEWLKQEYVR